MFFSAFTLGCKLNQLETEAIADSFCRNGFSFLPWDSLKKNQNDSGILVINTCTVTSMAEQKARRVIRKAMREHPKSCLIVTGCYAQMEKIGLEELEGRLMGRLFVVPGEAKDRLLDLGRFLSGNAADENPVLLRRLIASWLGSHADDKAVGGISNAVGVGNAGGAFRFVPEKFFSHSRAFIKVQDGCDRSCAYCRVSLARGKSRSLEANEVLKQLQALERREIAEAVLTGVNISQYSDSGMSLPELLEFLLNGTGKIRLRLSSIEPEPELFNEVFLRVLADKRIRPHFHLSLQSGSSAILAKMGRPYSPDDIEKIVALLSHIRQDPFLACDIIAGFSGETECEFEKTYTLMEKLGFAWIHAFPYSKRPGTAAFSFSDNVSGKDAARRVELLTSLARKGRLDYIQRWRGREVEAVVEAGENSLKGMVQAVTENYLKVCVDYGEEKAPAQGSLIRCRIAEIAETGSYDALACYIRPMMPVMP